MVCSCSDRNFFTSAVSGSSYRRGTILFWNISIHLAFSASCALLIANRAKSRSLLVVLLLGVNILMISGTLVYDFVAVKESLDRDRRMQAYYQGVRETVFREVVLKPIPKSVKNLEMKGSQYSTFRLTFDVSREDFQKILSARPYEKESEENPFFKGMLNYKYLENTGRRIRYGIMVNADASHVVFDRVME